MPIKRGVRATFLLTKKEGLSDEEFKNHYLNIHAPMGLPAMERHGVISYTQQYLSAKDKEELNEALSGHAPLIAYDAITTITFPDMAHFKSFLTDADNQGILREDSLNYAAPGKFQVGWGEEYVVIDEGKPVGN